MQSQSLPTLNDNKLDADGCIVWRLLISTEAAASNAKYRDELVGVRILGFFLLDFWDHGCHHSFGFTPYHKLRLEIASCLVVEDVAIGSPEETAAQHEKVFQLGLGYLKLLTRLYRSDDEPIPAPFERVPPLSFAKARERIVECIKEVPQTDEDAKDAALFRDGYRCAIAGHSDMESYLKYPELKERALEQGFATVATQCAHLFSESAQAGNKPKEYAATAFAILERFGLGDVVSGLLGGQVNSLFNTLTMADSLHTLFDKFFWWLEEVKNEPHTYDVCAAHKGFFRLIHKPPRRVVLKVDPAAVEYCLAKGYPVPELPDSRLIAIRAACARVAHRSGAVEHIEEIISECEASTVLAENGSSAELLTSLLHAVDVRG